MSTIQNVVRLSGPSGLVARCLRPPLGDRRFWITQTLVVLAATIYGFTVPGGGNTIPGLPPHGALSLFLIPVLYAAVNFGLSGSLATVGWVVLLGAACLVPWHNPEDVWAVGIQVGSLVCVAVFVGQRVEQEVRSRQEAEAARAAMRASEDRFRNLFETSPAPTLLVDAGGAVREANPAAAALFERPRAALLGTRLAELVGLAAAAAINDGRGSVEELSLPGGAGRYLRTVVSQAPGPGVSAQVVFLDVSEERRRLGVKDAYAAYVVKAQEEERARIAQELHDEPLQQVMQLCRQLEPGNTSWQPGEAHALARQVAAELRRLARGLRPPALEDLGLVAGLRLLARDMVERSSTRVELRVFGEPRRLEPSLELGLFRIAQEGLRNVERHARASRAALTLRFTPSEVTLTLTDDGCGLPEQPDPDRPAHLGLLGMQERASLLGGELDLWSEPGQGTTLSAAVPLA